MDTDWCLGCDRHTTTDGQAYCSKTCMLIDQSFLPRSYTLPSPQRPPSSRHRPRTTYHSARFDDEDVQVTWSGKDRAGILQWASSVHPGLQEETGPIPYPENPCPALVELQKVLFRPPAFPLTAQNLAPPCVTVAARHVTLPHAPSLTSQDDSSLHTPATESVASMPVKPPLLDRLVSQVCSWVATHPRASAEGNPSPPSDVGHSDETQRIVLHLPPTPIHPYPTA